MIDFYEVCTLVSDTHLGSAYLSFKVPFYFFLFHEY